MRNITLTLLLFFSISAHADQLNETATKAGFFNTIKKVESVISKLNPKLKAKEATKIATLVSIESKRQNLDPRVVLAILDTESSFNQNAVSPTGDISIAQINPKSWTPNRFKTKTGYELSHKRLRKDSAYAISRMCLILAFLKKNFAKEDKWWFARYHSSTPKYKKEYIHLLTKRFKKLKHFNKNLLNEMPSLVDIAKLKSKSTQILLAEQINLKEKGEN